MPGVPAPTPGGRFGHPLGSFRSWWPFRLQLGSFRLWWAFRLSLGVVPLVVGVLPVAVPGVSG
ncbi:hypothetical protein Shyhy02_80610 [Streptomyces hygroscopicus subsp. hygroscopicus]|nr:hypothetical protein Shyhy02_80610 [Streptomyces hygroscopicus subsp. hygroscopicus]